MKGFLVSIITTIFYVKLIECSLILTYSNMKFDYRPTIYDFGSNWTLRHVFKTGICYTYFPYFSYYNCSNDLLVFSNGTSKKTKCNNLKKIITQNNSLADNSHFVTINSTSQLNLFRIGDMSKKFN